MEIENYVDKSKKQLPEEPEKKIEAVVHAKGTRKRNRFVNSVISEEAGNVKNYILGDVLIPALKKAISDVVTNGIDMILYGETGHTKSRSGSKVSYISYDRSYSKDRDRKSDYRVSTYNFDDLVFNTRGEAELILDNLYEIIDRYRVATVADLYDLAGERSRYTDNKFGWDDISSASVVRIRDGFVIKLPRVMAID